MNKKLEKCRVNGLSSKNAMKKPNNKLQEDSKSHNKENSNLKL